MSVLGLKKKNGCKKQVKGKILVLNGRKTVADFSSCVSRISMSFDLPVHGIPAGKRPEELWWGKAWILIGNNEWFVKRLQCATCYVSYLRNAEPIGDFIYLSRLLISLQFNFKNFTL